MTLAFISQLFNLLTQYNMTKSCSFFGFCTIEYAKFSCNVSDDDLICKARIYAAHHRSVVDVKGS